MRTKKTFSAILWFSHFLCCISPFDAQDLCFSSWGCGKSFVWKIGGCRIWSECAVVRFDFLQFVHCKMTRTRHFCLSEIIYLLLFVWNCTKYLYCLIHWYVCLRREDLSNKDEITRIVLSNSCLYISELKHLPEIQFIGVGWLKGLKIIGDFPGHYASIWLEHSQLQKNGGGWWRQLNHIFCLLSNGERVPCRRFSKTPGLLHQ